MKITKIEKILNSLILGMIAGIAIQNILAPMLVGVKAVLPLRTIIGMLFNITEIEEKISNSLILDMIISKGIQNIKALMLLGVKVIHPRTTRELISNETEMQEKILNSLALGGVGDARMSIIQII